MPDGPSYAPLLGQLPYADRTRYPGQAVHSQLVQTVAPTVEPASLPLAKEWLGIEDNGTDQVILRLIRSARMTVEKWISRSLITQTWHLILDGFPFEIELRNPPIQSVSFIKFIDITTGLQDTLDPSIYQVDTDTEPARIRPAYLQVWPVYRTVPEAVTVEFISGYGATGASVPETIIDAILELVAFRWRNREPLSMGPNPDKVEAYIRDKVRGSDGWGNYS